MTDETPQHNDCLTGKKYIWGMRWAQLRTNLILTLLQIGRGTVVDANVHLEFGDDWSPGGLVPEPGG
jgi:hypothetical protein